MKWVKASERLPEIGKVKFMRAKGWGMFIGVNSIVDGKIHESSSLNPLEYDYEFIEWLDESTPPVSAMEDGLKEVIDACVRYRNTELDKHCGSSGLNFAINTMQELLASLTTPTK